MERKHYDFIFAGGGLSSTMLLYFFLQGSFSSKKFLLIDKNLPKRPYRQWSYWVKGDTPFDQIVTKKWSMFDVYFKNKHIDLPLQNYSLSLLESAKYYAFVNNIFKKSPNVECVKENVINIDSRNVKPLVYSDKHSYSADYVFDSISYKDLNATHNLYMQGVEASVVSQADAFNPNVLTFMDFRNAPANELVFFYVLPITKRHAFIDVAHTTIDTKLDYEKLLNEYIRKNFQTGKFSLHQKSFEKIPLGNNIPQRRVGKRVFKIGAAGGLIKPTTSYGFSNILKDSRAIVNSFSFKTGVGEYYVPSRISRVIDSVMLELMQRDSAAVRKMCSELIYGLKSGDSLLAYLSDELSLLESLKLITRVNPKPMAEIFKQRIKDSITGQIFRL